MEFNKNGRIDRYYDLDDILKLDLDNDLRENIEKKFGKTVFFDSDGSCKMGKLSGLEKNYQLGAMYYIIESNGNKIFVPVYKSITIV